MGTMKVGFFSGIMPTLPAYKLLLSVSSLISSMLSRNMSTGIPIGNMQENALCSIVFTHTLTNENTMRLHEGYN
jgi:hypothetical protein